MRTLAKSKNVEHVCCVDSISDGIVRLLIGTEGKNAQLLPLEFFPEGLKEGDWLNLIIEFNNDATKKGKQEVEDLYKELKKLY